MRIRYFFSLVTIDSEKVSVIMVDSNAVGLRIVFCVYDFHDCYPFVFVLEVKVHGLILDLIIF